MGVRSKANMMVQRRFVLVLFRWLVKGDTRHVRVVSTDAFPTQ
jgi:hypothetical protein